MIRLPGKGVQYGELWFDEELEQPPPDILVCRQRPEPWPGAKCSTFTTLVIDLSRPEEALLSSVGKHARHDIRRAGRDEPRSSFRDEPGAVLDEFSDFYDRFAATTGIPPVSRPWLRAAASLGRLALSWAGEASEPLVWHSYLLAPERARLVHSASLFRREDSGARARIGRLNRWLHWQDMLELKRRGILVYDFGGLFDNPSSSAEEGINSFKEGFGGTRRTEFDCVQVLTWKGRGYLALQGLWHRARAYAGRSDPRPALGSGMRPD